MAMTPTSDVRILDTDVFSFIYKNYPEATPYLDDLWGFIPALTFVTVAELYKWAYLRHWSARNLSNLEQRLHQYLILPYDESVARQWAKIQTAIAGRTYPANDAWIAATTITFGCTLLTHNPQDFQDIPGLDIISYSA